jgi:predicted MFS family arabinose efflux permease
MHYAGNLKSLYRSPLYLLFFMPKSIISLYKKSYGGLSSGTWWLSLVMLVNRMGTMVIPFMTMYLTQADGFSIDKAGLVMSVFGLGAIAGALIGGKLVDKIGYFYVQLFSLAGGGIMFIVLGQMHTYASICIVTFVLAMLNESFRPANTVAIAYYSKEENRTRSYSVNRLAINLGWAIGGALGGILASFNYSLLFWVDGMSNLSAAVLLYITLSPRRNPQTEKKIKTVLVNKSTVYQDRSYLLSILLVFIFALCFFQLFTTLPVFFKEKFRLSVFFIGMIMALNGILIACFEMITVFSLEGRRPALYYITFGMILTGLSFLLLNLPGIPFPAIAIIAMVVLTFGEIFTMPFMNSWWIGRAQSHNRGQYAALFTVAWASAQALGPFSGALIAEHFGFHSLWGIIGGICIVVAWLFSRVK